MLRRTLTGGKRSVRNIRTKQKSMKLFDDGYFGNTIKQWYKHNEWLMQASKHGSYVLRQWKRALGGSGYCKYNLSRIEVVREITRLRATGHDMSTFCISEAMPDYAVTLQGEYMAGPSTLFYSTETSHMRPALESSGQHAYGPHADLLVRSAMCGRGYEKFCELVDRHTTAVIEFSCYSQPVGIKHWNTMIWECQIGRAHV